MLLFSDLGLYVPCVPSSRVPNTFLSPQMGYVLACSPFRQNKPQSKSRISLMKTTSPSFSSFISFIESHSYRALHFPTSSSLCRAKETCDEKVGGNLSEEHTLTEEIRLDCFSNCINDFGCEADKESLRRRKIGIANKGKVPWNKGKKHSAETCVRIRQRTKEALRDPKVRQKMSECARAHSNKTKARIRLSLKRLWRERLKWKREREKFLLSWASSIAKAAKIGGSDQQELEWDSYEKMKVEISFQQLQWAADRAKAKEMARIRGQRVAKEKEERLARFAQKRKEQEVKTKGRVEIRRKSHKKSKEEREELAVAQELKLKERLTKIHRKKSSIAQVTSQDHRAWERLDLELVKRDRTQNEVSLADQIRSVKNRRALTTTPIYLSSESSLE